MRATRAVVCVGLLGFCLLDRPIQWLSGIWRPTPPLASPGHQVHPAPECNPVAAALRATREDWRRAKLAVNREREARLEAGLPEAMDTDSWRRLLMARDREGYLQRARVAALRGV